MAADGSLIFNTKMDVNGFNRGINKISSKAIDLKNKIKVTENQISSLQKELNKMENTPFKSDAAAKLEREVAKAKESLNTLYAEADKIGDSVKQNLEETGFTLEHLDNILASNKGWQKIQSQIDVAEQKLEKYERELRNVKAVDSQVNVKETAAYTEKSQKLEELSGNLDYYKAKLQETSVEEQNTTAEITESSDELTSSIMSSSDLITMSIKAVTSVYETFKKVVVTTAKAIANASVKIAQGIGYVTEQVAKFTLKQFIGDWEKQGSGLSKIILTAASYFSIYKLFDLGKEGVELGSDLAEVQNVVDVTFSSMSDKVENFAKSAEKTYGLSETMAKKYVGLYGSMAEAFGFTEQQAYDMSTTLTGLAGDVVSFYNIDQDLAYTKLKSVFSGETETLKDLGIVMTQNALDSYAMAKGLGKTTSEMTEAEKVTLRYNFVLDQLSNAQGDFVRTQNSWANQVRILQLRWQSLLSTIGKGLINIFTPVLQILNVVLDKLQSVAEWFENIVTSVFGDSSDTSGAVTEDLVTAENAASDLANGATSAADAVSDISGAATELKDNIANFDELNIMDGTQDDSSIDDLVADVVNATGVIDSALTDTVDNAVKKSEEELKQASFDKAIVYAIKHGQWKQVGYLVAEKISTALDKIQWDDIQSQAVEIATNIGEFINGALMNEDFWKSVGRTLAKALNTAILFLLTLIKEIDWAQFGKDLAIAFDEFMDTFDAKEYGELAAEKINAIFDFLGGFAWNFPWNELGDKVGETLSSYFQTLNLNEPGKSGHTIPETIAKILNGLIQAGIELLTYEFTDEDGNVHNLWEYIGTVLGEGLNQFLETFSLHDAIRLIKSGVSAFVKVIYNAFKKIAGEDGKGFTRLGSELAGELNGWFEDEDWWTEIGEMLDEIVNDLLDLLLGFIVNLDIGKVNDALDALCSKIDFDGIFSKLLLVASIALDKAVALFLKRIPWIGDTLGIEHKTFLKLVHGEDYADMIYGSLDPYENKLTKASTGGGGRSFGETIGGTIGNDVTTSYGKAVEKGESNMKEKTVSAVSASMNQASSTVKNDTSLPLAFKTQGINSQNALTGNFKASQVTTHFKDVWDGIKGVFAGVSQWFEDTFGNAWKKVKGIFSDKNGISNIKKSVEEVFKNTLNDFISGINDIIANPFDALNSAFNSIRGVEFFGAKVFEWLPVITVPQIPKLATGTVVPANYGEFLAVLGDNKREAEVVSPISAMKQAMSEVLAEFGGAGNGDITLTVNLDGREIYRSVVEQNERQRKRTGKSPLA